GPRGLRLYEAMEEPGTRYEGETRRPRQDMPAELGRFVLLHRVGAGGMGIVYAAHDPELDHKVAVSPYGVIGMNGNVQEWVQDWRGQTYYATCPAMDPPGPEGADGDSDYKIVRGGYWDSYTLEGNTSTSVSLRRWGRIDRGSGRV